jgi:hypothetical protein
MPVNLRPQHVPLFYIRDFLSPELNWLVPFKSDKQLRHCIYVLCNFLGYGLDGPAFEPR